jgi:hypothetical protein
MWRLLMRCQLSRQDEPGCGVFRRVGGQFAPSLHELETMVANITDCIGITAYCDFGLCLKIFQCRSRNAIWRVSRQHRTARRHFGVCSGVVDSFVQLRRAHQRSEQKADVFLI